MLRWIALTVAGESTSAHTRLERLIARFATSSLNGTQMRRLFWTSSLSWDSGSVPWPRSCLLGDCPRSHHRRGGRVDGPGLVPCFGGRVAGRVPRHWHLCICDGAGAADDWRTGVPCGLGRSPPAVLDLDCHKRLLRSGMAEGGHGSALDVLVLNRANPSMM